MSNKIYFKFLILITVLAFSTLTAKSQLVEYNKRFIYGYSSFDARNGTKTIASNGNYRLDFQSDANLVLYNGSTALWNSRTAGREGGGLDLVFSINGAISLTHFNGRWWSGSLWTADRAIWVLQDDGNFVGYSDYTMVGNYITAMGHVLGSTNTAGGKVSNRNGRLR